MPVSIAAAAMGGQPICSTISGSRRTDPRGGALPRIIERRIQSLLQAIWMKASDQSRFLVYFGTARKWPSTQVRLWSLAVWPGTVAQIHLPPVFESFRVVDQGAVGGEGLGHGIAVGLAAGDDLVEFPGRGLGRHDLVLQHQASPEFQRGDRLSLLMKISPVLKSSRPPPQEYSQGKKLVRIAGPWRPEMPKP